MFVLLPENYREALSLVKSKIAMGNKIHIILDVQ